MMAVKCAAGAAVGEEEVSESTPSVAKVMPRPEDEIRAVARKFSDQPLQNPEPGVWAVLTAISKNARQRSQGMNILLSVDEHWIGRCVEDPRFQIATAAVSGTHCKIFREKLAATDGVSVFLKDRSTNGTYLNWERLRKTSPKARLQHGDMISFIAPPHDDRSFAFVYREVQTSIGLENGPTLKRKSEDIAVENKRMKGIGIGAPDGPVSLDDVRSLQRSNTELRQQLESHVLTIESLRSENRATIARQENELKQMKESISGIYLDQIKELQTMLDAKQKGLDVLSSQSAELRHLLKDLNERLSASMQSRTDADEIIYSQKATISELEARIDEERTQRREEREKSAVDLKAALQRVQLEAQDEIKRQAEVYLRQHREQQEVISKLQESEKESRLLVETLRSKLEDARESLVTAEKKVRHLEVQVQDAQMVSASSQKKLETLENEVKRLRKELESEKVAREEAWAKVSALELEIAAAIRDLSIEKQRFQGARERIILRETQLRAFYSTTEEITALFAKQQEQLKAMQKTLEDEEKCDNAAFDIDLNAPVTKNITALFVNKRELHRNNTTEASGASGPMNNGAINYNSGDDNDDDTSVTEKHECDPNSQDGNTQDLECTCADKSGKGFGSDINGVGTAVIPDGDPIDTERVLGTESPDGNDSHAEHFPVMHKCTNLVEDTMQLDDEAQVQDGMEPHEKLKNWQGDISQARIEEDTEPGTIRTADLLASEVAGSWAVSTAPSVHGENDSPKSTGDAGARGEEVAAADCAAALLLCSDGQAAGSQSNVPRSVTRLSDDLQALNAMIEIVAPGFRQQFPGGVEVEKSKPLSDAETDEDGDATDGSSSEGDTDADNPVEDGNEVMIEDSVG